MKTLMKQRHVGHTSSEMFGLVADVENYPKFVPLCENLVVRERNLIDGKTILIADMTAAYKLFRETFTSRVTIDPDAMTILVEYIDGPFSHLENRWQFRSNGAEGCEIEFYLAYEFRARSLQILLGAVFDRAFGKFTSAFEQRADAIYGRPPAPAAKASRLQGA